MRHSQPLKSKPFRVRPALTLAEAIISMVIISVMLLAALNTVGASRFGRSTMTLRARGNLLAQELMSEILQQSYEEPVDDVDFGRESESGGDRGEYDDVDDYLDWSSSPPEDRDGTALIGFDAWERRADVIWVSSSDLNQAVLYETGIKRITVEVLHNNVPVASVVALVTDAALRQRYRWQEVQLN